MENQTLKLIVDCTSNDNYFVITYLNGKQYAKISKKCNTLENVKRLIGVLNIEKII